VESGTPPVRRMGRDRIDGHMPLLLVAGLAAASYALREVRLAGLDPHVIDEFQGWVHNHDATSWLWQPGEGMSIAALGISPYVTASIVLQLICVLARHVGAAAVREVTSTRIDRAAMIGAVLVGLYHGWSRVVFQEGFVWAKRPIVASPGWGFRVVAICAMLAGSMLLVMLARLETRLARVNGVAVLIALGAARTILRSTSQATTDAPPSCSWRLSAWAWGSRASCSGSGGGFRCATRGGAREPPSSRCPSGRRAARQSSSRGSWWPMLRGRLERRT